MKYLIVFLVILGLYFCSVEKQNTYYFLYDEPLIRFENTDIISYTFNYKANEVEYDTVRIPFKLTYRKSSNDYFVKPLLYLDSIKINNASWFNETENVLTFWNNNNEGIHESIEIYVGELINDSIIFRKVQKSFIPWR